MKERLLWNWSPAYKDIIHATHLATFPVPWKGFYNVCLQERNGAPINPLMSKNDANAVAEVVAFPCPLLPLSLMSNHIKLTINFSVWFLSRPSPPHLPCSANCARVQERLAYRQRFINSPAPSTAGGSISVTMPLSLSLLCPLPFSWLVSHLLCRDYS